LLISSRTWQKKQWEATRDKWQGETEADAKVEVAEEAAPAEPEA
jgi:hypothetical protein